MRRKKKELVVAPKCEYCGERSETFVCTADHLTFCRIQYVGHPPIKDCMTDYYEEKKNVQKKEKESSLWTQQKVGFQNKENEKEKVLTDRKTAIRKLDELKQFLSKKKQASFQKQPSYNTTYLKRI